MSLLTQDLVAVGLDLDIEMCSDHGREWDCKSSNKESEILNYEQICRLEEVLNETLTLCGDCGSPMICLTIKDFISTLKYELENAEFPFVDLKLNGGAAATVMDAVGDHNDVDLLITLLPSADPGLSSQLALHAVLATLTHFLPPPCRGQRQMAARSYIHKSVRVRDPLTDDCWSLLGIGSPSHGRVLDLKFCLRMRRQFQFSVDSLQIGLLPLLLFSELQQQQNPYSSPPVNDQLCECSRASPLPGGGCSFCPRVTGGGAMCRHFFPTVRVTSGWHCLQEAVAHLHHREICTVRPEEIRGGGLLKYCNLMAQGYSLSSSMNSPQLETYMCSRFFIDFKDVLSQRRTVESYLRNHFTRPFNVQFGCPCNRQCTGCHGDSRSGNQDTAFRFLGELYRVVNSASVCLMKHERQQALLTISDLASLLPKLPPSQQTNHSHLHPDWLTFASNGMWPPPSSSPCSMSSHSPTDSSYDSPIFYSQHP